MEARKLRDLALAQSRHSRLPLARSSSDTLLAGGHRRPANLPRRRIHDRSRSHPGYLDAIGTVPTLTEDEEAELSRPVLAKDDQAESAGKTLVEASLAMVVAVAQRYPRGNAHLLDLVAEAVQAPDHATALT